MKSLIAVALLALSAGCASLGSVASDESGPLRAYLLPHSSLRDMSFHVSRPAYVAVFRLAPGGGAALVYPYAGASPESSFAYSGFHSLSFGRRDGNFRFAGLGMAERFGPEFYFMIASEEPLRLEQFGAFGDRLSTAMGSSFAFGSGHMAMERLVELAVPNVANESWTTDYYVHWPEDQAPSRGRNMVQILCNGTIINVPITATVWAMEQLCGQVPIEQPASPPAEPGTPPVETPPAETPADSIVEPVRREPVAPRERISSIQLTAPEAWERLRDVAENAAVARTLRTREGVDSDPFPASDAGREYLNRPQPATRSSGNSGNSGNSSTDATPRSRPAPESSSPSTPSAERERPSGSDGGSVERPLTPIQPE